MKDLYVGIDLGTTNSVIAYGNITKRGDLKCNVLDIERKTENGGIQRSKTLPSVVFYSRNPKTQEIIPEVGDYAKSRYGTKVGYVSKSIKSIMGVENSAYLADEIDDKTPAAVSAQILRHLLHYGKKMLMEDELNDVVITVPASFDFDQCAATLEAARLAGINTDNIHDILLYEPKAVIYDFINMQEQGELPNGLINLDKPQNILVFDLGGGTLDVTIHKLSYTEGDILNIEDLAISRYTKIGGDNFDELLAQTFYNRLEKQTFTKIPTRRKEEVMCKLRKLAEDFKVKTISNYYNRMQELDKPIDPDYTEEVYEMNVYDNCSYMDEFSIQEIEDIIKPLMGTHLKLSDVDRIDSLKESDMNNIIYPILDVLAKAGSDCKIDAVILNGGMTKFYPIKKRIDEFFGIDSLVTSDPDLAVARGAVYYHYCLHKYNIKRVNILDDVEAVTDNANSTDSANVAANTSEMVEAQPACAFNTSTILNDNLNLGLTSQYVSSLVKAGQKLPYRSPEISGKYQFGVDSDTIAISIFLGRGKTKNLPNRKIADRIVKFNKVYPAGTPISISITIDSLRMMKIEAWITGNKAERAIIQVDTNTKKAEKSKVNAAKINTTEAQYLNPKAELNQIKTLSNLHQKLKDRSKKLNAVMTRIDNATNKAEFFEPIQDMLFGLTQSDILRGNIYRAARSLSKGWSDKQKQKMLSICKSHFEPRYDSIKQNEIIIYAAIDYIAEIEGNEFFNEVLNREHKSSQHGLIKRALYRREMQAKNLENADNHNETSYDN